MKISRLTILSLTIGITQIVLFGLLVFIDWSYINRVILFFASVILTVAYFYLINLRNKKEKEQHTQISTNH